MPAQIMAALITVVGCAFVARPSVLFGDEDGSESDELPLAAGERRKGIAAAFAGVLLGSCVFVLIRRARPTPAPQATPLLASALPVLCSV